MELESTDYIPPDREPRRIHDDCDCNDCDLCAEC